MRVEDYGAREDVRAEERLELGLDGHIHPHPLERRTAAVQLGGELRLHSREHVHISCRSDTVGQIDHAKSLSLEADLTRFKNFENGLGNDELNALINVLCSVRSLA